MVFSVSSVTYLGNEEKLAIDNASVHHTEASSTESRNPSIICEHLSLTIGWKVH
jgi:hypothetical protein